MNIMQTKFLYILLGIFFMLNPISVGGVEDYFPDKITILYAKGFTIEYKENYKIVGVKCEDLETNNSFEIKGVLVINATGIWTDELIENYPENIPKPIQKFPDIIIIFRECSLLNNRKCFGCCSNIHYSYYKCCAWICPRISGRKGNGSP